MAFCCDICVIVKYGIFLLAGFALVIVYFTIGFSWLTGVTVSESDTTDYELQTYEKITHLSGFL